MARCPEKPAQCTNSELRRRFARSLSKVQSIDHGCAWNAVSAFAQLTDVPSHSSGAAIC
jgi:hypothetical protein